MRSTDTFADLECKVELATILGTIQATFTDFKYLSKIWQKNTAEERLLGVSLTGIMDHGILNGSDSQNTPGFDDFISTIGEFSGEKTFNLEGILGELREHARKTNRTWAKKLGIPESAGITCVEEFSALAA